MPIDWAWIAEKAPAIITGAKDVVLAIAAACTALFAWKALDKWRMEAVGKRRIELAEEVLAGFYQIRDIIQDARAPLVLAKEMVRQEGVPDEVAVNAYYAPIRRLSYSFDKIADLRSKRYQFAAVFGADKSKPWAEIEGVLLEIDIASDALVRWGSEHLGPDHPSAQFYNEQRRILSRRKDDDPIEPKLSAAVAEIERHCVPVIQATIGRSDRR